MRNLKKVIALVAVFAMLVSSVAFAQTFTDVAEDHDYYEAIEMLSNLEILTGDDQDGDGKMDFRAEDKITRAEVAVIISRIQGINNAAQVATDFVDVPSTHWASGYVAQAAGQGIVNGYGDGNFGPEDNVLYEQAVKMLMETLGYAPFVEANGGYPTGHLTAAQRYGVVAGVVGAAPGVEATRGQVAQMVYNAIDTPIMDRYSYGADAEYMIFDGKSDREFITLLTRALGVKKFTAVLDENSLTTLAAAKTLDTEEEAIVDFDFNATVKATADWDNYEMDDVKTIYEGESGAGALIGQEVEVYIKEGNRRGVYEIVSATATGKNDTLTIGLDQFVQFDYANNKIEYWKNASDRLTTTVEVKSGADVLLNGVAVASDYEATLWSTLKNTKTWSGAITLIDNGSDNDYTVISIEVGTPAVVDAVTANGKVSLKEKVKSVDNAPINLVFDEDDAETLIVLIKNGAVIDYTELAEWDVLSVLANRNNGYVVAEVIEGGKIEGSVASQVASTTSATTFKYSIDGDTYDVANYAYGKDDIAPGSEGTFYIDNYGKIVAYNETGSSVASDKYAFIIKAKAVSDGWTGTAIKVQLLDKSGEVYEAYLADKVKIENEVKTEFIKTDKQASYTSNSYKAEDIDTTKFEALVKNAFVTYEANSNGEIKTITFAQTDPDVNDLYYDVDKHYDASADYDAEDRFISVKGKKYDVDDETLVFYMYNGTSDNVAVNGALATDSKVDTIASLNTGGDYTAFIYDANQDTVPVIVLYDTKGGLDKSSSIALIDSVGSAIVGEDIVDAVTFFKDGEKFTAYTDLDLDVDFVAGEAYKLSLSADGTTITGATWYGKFDLERTKDTDVTGTAKFTAKFTAIADAGLEKTYFGPVVGYQSSKDAIRIAPYSSGLGEDLAYDADVVYNFADYTTIKAIDANVYVIDPVRTTNKISAGYASDVEFEEEVIEAVAAGKAIDFETADWDIAAGVDALGMMDFVAAFEYDDEITDVVIIKAYDFGYKWEVKDRL